MAWLRNLSLVKLITVSFLAMAVVIASMGAAAIFMLKHQEDAFRASPAWKAADTSANAALHAATQADQAAFAACATLASLLAAWFGWVIRANIKRSVESTIEAVSRIAAGDLETRIESPGKDEISWLRSELNGMRKKLRATVLLVRDTVHSVDTASAEIASGNGDLSQRTEVQSSALQETASSMRQLAETVRANADSTREARAVVAQSSEVAGRGSEMMQGVIDRMSEISTSSRKIVEIIAVIDGIAFQTNILALNAAVEAARAGEQGRGFAVVATEVRTLAQRSAAAAREIKTLITDSSTKVEAGASLVGDAGATMHDILESVKRLSVLVGSIAEAGELQSTEIGQVHGAVAQLDTMTQQNAALVEQIAATAQSLKGQTVRLTDAMGAFQVAH